MGDATAGPVRLLLNPQVRVEFHGATVTSDAGLLLPRESDERLGLSTLIERHLHDPRTGYNRQFPLSDLFRQSISSRLAGYKDTNDAERLAEDPTFQMLGSRERRETSIVLTSPLHWFETAVLAEERNYPGLARLNTAVRATSVVGDGPSSAAGREDGLGHLAHLRRPAVVGPCAPCPRAVDAVHGGLEALGPGAQADALQHERHPIPPSRPAP
jgi:hypothetical protein